MTPCHCQAQHARRRVVLTGGPGAGKTAVLELVRQAFCRHVDVLPEAASILFAGGFRRSATVIGRESAQRAIFHVQRELETVAEEQNHAVTLCDRGTVDGFAYWPHAGDGFWAALGTTRAEEFARYDTVIHLRTPPAANGYNHANPMRIETAAEAAAIDERIEQAWAGHPRRFVIDSEASFLTKANRALALLRAEVPECCRGAVAPGVGQ